MYLFFFIMWIIFNGRITPEIIIFGAVLSVFIYIFFIRFMGYDPKTNLKIVRNFLRTVKFIAVLIIEVVKANIDVIRLVLSRDIEVEPVLISFKTDLISDLSKVALANCITLTPGTITCELAEDGVYTVHCLDEEMAGGMSESKFVQLLRGFEEE